MTAAAGQVQTVPKKLSHGKCRPRLGCRQGGAGALVVSVGQPSTRSHSILSDQAFQIKALFLPMIPYLCTLPSFNLRNCFQTAFKSFHAALGRVCFKPHPPLYTVPKSKVGFEQASSPRLPVTRRPQQQAEARQGAHTKTSLGSWGPERAGALEPVNQTMWLLRPRASQRAGRAARVSAPCWICMSCIVPADTGPSLARSRPDYRPVSVPADAGISRISIGFCPLPTGKPRRPKPCDGIVQRKFRGLF
jgi:hypothetical protein